MTDDELRVSGYCPMGCGQTLFLEAGGRITCKVDSCPQPNAVDILLQDRETEHVVRVLNGIATTRHPLRERIGGDLMACDLHASLTEVKPSSDWFSDGVYQARRHPVLGGWELTKKTTNVTTEQL